MMYRYKIWQMLSAFGPDNWAVAVVILTVIFGMIFVSL